MAKPALPLVVSAQFIAEVRPEQRLPPPGPPEVAIAGRSNVGKSTLLNRLVGRRALARTSKTPGRTRGIMFYELQVRWPGSSEDRPMRLVDLPGYGYAQVSQEERRSWQPLVESYVAGPRHPGPVPTAGRRASDRGGRGAPAHRMAGVFVRPPSTGGHQDRQASAAARVGSWRPRCGARCHRDHRRPCWSRGRPARASIGSGRRSPTG